MRAVVVEAGHAEAIEIARQAQRLRDFLQQAIAHPKGRRTVWNKDCHPVDPLKPGDRRAARPLRVAGKGLPGHITCRDGAGGTGDRARELSPVCEPDQQVAVGPRRDRHAGLCAQLSEIAIEELRVPRRRTLQRHDDRALVAHQMRTLSPALDLV